MNRNIFFFLIAFLFCGYSYASCTPGGQGQVADFTFNDLNIQRDVPVGTVLLQKEVSVPATVGISAYSGACTQEMKMNYAGATKTSLASVYNTNIPGVGIKVFTYTHSGAGAYDYFENPGKNNSYSAASGMSTYTYWTASNVATVYLVKTGDITSGRLAAGEIGRVTNLETSTVLFNINTSGGNINSLACSIESGNGLSFPIGDVLTTEFKGVNSTPDKMSTVDLKLDCNADANINIKLNGVQNPDSTEKSILALSGNQGQNGVADGVGVQLLYNGTPLEINKLITLKKSSGGKESFPITARYIQTKEAIRPGAANATAVLELIYQ
ncbi:fimbrial protein [Enterobacter asburiae]|uniref:fimbrial protein n=1 Tax=Enterobacter asburiae TaxID=61645 RepID=UPI002FCFC6D4